jgi:ketosteroid isomerase-like protein
MVDEDLRRRMDRVESRALLRELATAYCIAADDRDLAGLGRLFTDDVFIASRDGAMMNARGRDAAVAMFDRMFEIRGPSCHWTHDMIVHFDDADADRARGLVIAHAETTPNGRASVAAIRYHDVYRREAGTWRFAERILHFLYYLPVADYAARLPTAERIGVYGEWHTADFPESLDCWQEWFRRHGRAPGA